MSQLCDPHFRFYVSGERGASRLNLLIVVMLIVVVTYVGYQYVPVAYQSSLLKVYMQDTVNNAVASDKSVEWVKGQLRASADDYGVPEDAIINVEKRNQRMEAHIQFTRAIPLPGFVYQYNFDHTVRSNNFISGSN